ncbi:hypothetical protein Q3G72_024671 [Acer saccharum]|nr:hypothetical protein Q3G72_024671 [Acer saccharum]
MAYHELPGDDSCQVKATFDENIIQIEQDMNLRQAICTGNFWLLFIAMICGLGSGYVSDIFLQRRGLAMPLFIAITQAGLSVGYIVIASGFPNNL